MTRAQGSRRPTTTTPPTASASAPGRTSDATPAVTAPMRSERRKVSGWAEKRAAGRAGREGSARGSRRVLPAMRARPARPGRAGGAAGGRAADGGSVWQEGQEEARTNVAADSARAPHTSFCGVHVSVTVKPGPPSACRSAAVTCHPLAKPSVSCERPRSTACAPAPAPAAVCATAFHPLFTLCPSTNSKGWVARSRLPSWCRCGSRSGCRRGRRRAGSPITPGCPAQSGTRRSRSRPPAAESNVSWSRSHPVQVCGSDEQVVLCPAAVSTTWVPALKVMPPASGRRGPPAPRSRSAPAAWIRRPSRRSGSRQWRAFPTQLPGSAAGVGAEVTPGMPTSAIPSGKARGPAE